MNTSPTNLSHKTLYSSTPVLATNPGQFTSSLAYSSSTTPPISPAPITGIAGSSHKRISTARGGNLSPLLKSSVLHASPLKSSPPLSDKFKPQPLHHAPPVRVTQSFHNCFYALRLNISIKGCPVELDTTDEAKLSCEQLTCSTSFRPIYSNLQHLMTEYGVSGFVQCFSDPQPLIQVSIGSTDALRTLLTNKEKIVSYLWVMVCNEFISTSKDIGIGLLKGEYRDASSVRFQLTHRPGNNCSIDLYLISPKSHQREVDIYPVTLANFEYAHKLLMSSLIFDFQPAMTGFLLSSKNPLQEKVTLSDLKEELKQLTNWFHLGLHLGFKPSALMNTLFNCRNIAACRGQFLSVWYNQQTTALGENILTWTTIVDILVDVGQKRIADNIVKQYGLDVNEYHEMLKQKEKTKDVLNQSVLSVAPLVAELKDLDGQISERTKPLRTYKLQEKNLEISVNEVFKNLKSSIETIREKSAQRVSMKEGITKISEEIESLEAMLQLMDAACATNTDQGLESPPTQVINEAQHTSPSHYKAISNILEEKVNQRQRFKNTISGLNREMKALTTEITEERTSLIKEHQLLLSKSQQIHQLQGVMGILEAKANACGMRIDQQLQQQYAATSMFRSSVYQLHIDTLTQESKEKDSQLTLYIAREKRAQKMATETQKKLEDMDLNEETGEMTLQGAEGEQDEDRRLDEWLKPVVESVELRNKLLKGKLGHWNNERSKRITSAEGKALAQMLNAMKEISVEQHDSKPDEVHDDEIDGDHQSVKFECYLKLNTTNQQQPAVKLNSMVRFTLELDPSIKLNTKKFSYRVDVKSIASNSITPTAFTSNTDPGLPGSTLSFDFRPSIRGRHQVLIWCNNKPMKGSGTYLFKAKQSPTLLGYPVRVIDGLNYPYNVCSIPNSKILLVSESKGHKVLFIDKATGNRILNIGGMKQPGLMKIPNGVAITENGVICVVDSGSHCVCLFTQQGVPIGKFGTKGDAFNDFCFPYGIKVSPSDHSVAVCDHSNNRVQIFSKDLNFQKAFNASCPYDLAYDSKNCIHVTDRRNHLIAVFNEKDQCIHSISGKGSEEGKLREPRGITIDEQDFIYVVEERNCRVSVFDNLGQFVSCFGSEGSQPGEFSAPQGICIDEDGYFYICDMLNNRIQVF